MIEPEQLALELRDSLRPLWRRLNAYKSLSASKIGILFHLEQNGPQAVSRLATWVRVSHQAIATAVRELEESQLVSRRPDPDDGRRVLVKLTSAGADRLAAERTSGQEWLEYALVTQFDDAERATLEAALPLLRRLAAENPR